MHRCRRRTLIFAIVAATALSFVPSRQVVSQDLVRVSLIQLIATPKAFDGKLVRTIGFLRVEFEGTALYLHQDDFKHAITQNALWVDLPYESKAYLKLNMKYVIVEGRFSARDHGHMGLFGGAIHTITRADYWSSPSKPYGEELRRHTR